jgi:thymidylate synthase
VDLLRKDPLSRRAVVAIYDPRVDVNPGKDIPCNDFLQFQSRLGELHLTVTVRSNDVMWGWSGINAFEWSTLQEIVASLLGISVGTLTFNIGSLHLYEQHWKKARLIEYEEAIYRRIPFDPHRNLPNLEDVDDEITRWFAWEDLCRNGKPVSKGLSRFESPLVRAWAQVIAHYWTGDEAWLDGLGDTALAVAVARTPKSLLPSHPAPSSDSQGPVLGAGPGHGLPEPSRAFYEFVTDLHAKKHTSYGDSWRRRGETLSILANIARKVDRLGVGDEFDSAADTLIDLWVYTAKYLNWLRGGEDTPAQVNLLLLVSLRDERHPEKDLITLMGDWDRYMDDVIQGNLNDEQKQAVVSDLLIRVAPMALTVWLSEQDEYRGADVD